MIVNNDTSQANAAAAGAGAAGGSAKLAENFDNFLKLLTTQMSNQDPLAPLDATQFTSQLAQFTGVEQAVATNANLEQLIAAQKSNQSASAVSYLGKMVEAHGNRAALSDGRAEWSYTLGGNAATTEIQILDAQGHVVRTLAGETGAGSHTLVWDGRDDTGATAPDGVYTIQVAARTPDDAPVQVRTNFVGQVTGVSLDGDEIMLSVDGRDVALGNVISVREAETP